MPTNNIITAESKPEWAILGLWGDYWECSDLIKWHKLLVQKWGLEKANEIFISEWNNSPPINVEFNCRSLNDNFKQYAKENGFYDSLFDGISGLLGKTVSAGESVISSTDSAVSNVVEGITKSTKILKQAIPIIIIAASIYLIVYTHKKLAK